MKPTHTNAELARLREVEKSVLGIQAKFMTGDLDSLEAFDEFMNIQLDKDDAQKVLKGEVPNGA